jgi:hypothetical protein
MKTIVTIFVENTKNLDLLLKYLKKSIELKQIDEVHFWNYTKTEDDKKFSKKLSDILSDYTQIFKPIKNNELSLLVSTAIQNKGFYLMNVCDKNKSHYYCDYYKKSKFRNDTIIKCDDTISYIDLQKLPKFIEFIKNNNFCEIVLANIINNNTCSLYQQNSFNLIPKSLINFDIQSNNNYDEKIHNYFIENYKKFINYDCDNDNKVIHIKESDDCKYNFIGYKASIFYKFARDDENSSFDSFLKNKNLKIVMYSDFYVSYLSKEYLLNEFTVYKLIYSYNQFYKKLYEETTQTNQDTNIVVSRYNKNVDFTYKINNGLDINILIYDKENPENPFNIPVNKGQEASVYLKYIIDFYDSLSEYTFFIHDEEFSWHHSGSIVDKYNEAKASSRLYYNINDLNHWKERNSIKKCHGYKLFNLFMSWYTHFFEEYIPISKIPNKNDFIYGFLGSGQFLVHKKLITNLPKEFYEKLYDWIITTRLENWITSRFLEWTWHIMWVIYPHFIKT